MFICSSVFGGLSFTGALERRQQYSKSFVQFSSTFLTTEEGVILGGRSRCQRTHRSGEKVVDAYRYSL